MKLILQKTSLVLIPDKVRVTNECVNGRKRVGESHQYIVNLMLVFFFFFSLIFLRTL